MIVLTAVLAVAAGVTAAAYEMFLSAHDLQVALVVVALSAAGDRGGDRRARPPARAAPDGFVRQPASIGSADYDRSAPPTPSSPSSPASSTPTTLRLCEARDRERRLEASRRELVAWVSHDLRTPLAGLRAMAEALEDGVVDRPGDRRRYHRQIRAVDVERLTGMVDDLFELSRLQAGTLQLTLSQASLSDLVSDAVAAVDPLAAGPAGAADRHGRRLSCPSASTSAKSSACWPTCSSTPYGTRPPREPCPCSAAASGRSAWISVTRQLRRHPGRRPCPRVRRGVPRDRPAGPPTPAGGLGLAIVRGHRRGPRRGDRGRERHGGCRFTVVLPLAQPA